MSEPLLEVRDLHITFEVSPGPGPIQAVDGISFSVRRGERFGLAGESGSGKSATALSIMGLLPTPPATVAGSVVFEGRELLGSSERQWRSIRGARVALIFQDPMTSLDPAMTIGEQIAEAILAHKAVSRRQARQLVIDLLGRVGIPSPRISADQYPHRFSGGMRQRTMIAMALACNPDLIIADEPTTALDVTTQGQILELLSSVCEERGTAVILITHDLGIMAAFADRIAIMYAGKIVEEGSVGAIFHSPSHPYTWGLLGALTRLDRPRCGRLSVIKGNPPWPTEIPAGCRFHPRCPYREEVCEQRVPELVGCRGSDHLCACHLANRLTLPAAFDQVVPK